MAGSRVKRAFILSLKLVVIGLLFWYMARTLESLDLGKVAAVGHGWRWMVLAQLFIGSMLLMSYLRWMLLLRAQGIRYSFRETVALGFIGFFFNQFIPGSTGGDLVKAYYVAIDHPERRAAGVTTVFLDRAVGLLVLVLVAAASIVLNWSKIVAQPDLRTLAILVAAALMACGAAGTLFFSPRFRSSGPVRAVLGRLPFRGVLSKIQAAVYVYRFHPRLVLVVLFLSLVVQLSIVGMACSYARALDWPADPATFLFIVPLAHLALAIPTGSPGGLGQSEFAYSFLFQELGYRDGILLGLIERINWCLWALVGCVYYFRRRGSVRRALELAGEAEEEEESPLEEEGIPTREAME